MKDSFRIAEISFGASQWDKLYHFKIENSHFDVLRMGANFSIETLKAIIKSLRNEVDAFALTDLPPAVKINGKSYIHRQCLEIMQTPCSVPLCDGTGLREIANLNSMIQVLEGQKISPEQGVFLPAAFLSVEIEEFLRSNFKKNIFLGDAYPLLGLPWLIRPFPGLTTLAEAVLNFANLKDIRKNTPRVDNPIQKLSRSAIAAQLKDIQYVCCDLPFLLLYEEALAFVKDKDVIIWSHHPKMEEELKSHFPRRIINLFPEEYRFSSTMNYSVLDAAMRLKYERRSAMTMDEWGKLLAPDIEIRQLARKYADAKQKSFQAKFSYAINSLKSELSHEARPDFAFIIHALNHQDFSHLPGIGPWVKYLPPSWNDSFDRAVALAPPMVWGKIRHIQSQANGREVQGIIYALASTPKVLQNTPPEVTYAKIEKICADAEARGAKIIGLGAYTKMIGDSGLTIHNQSPIPVTTGNSLSASATLWGLYDVVSRMKLLNRNPNTGRVQGIAMIIGASGSIGSVSAKLLAMVFTKIVLVAPRMNRLQALQAELNILAPHCEVVITTDANYFAESIDVLVTATSAFDQKIVDIMRLNPGCVVCDCSRPLDFSIEDAKKRPDILILESGEVNLPGPVQIDFDLQLPGNSVYACLGETALLALEERYEAFTLGRDIDWVKVKEIYKLALKHGVKLSAVQGHMGFISDREIALTRELAISRRSR